MKILYHHRIRSKDGQYVHLSELVRAFEHAGHEVHLVGPALVDEQPFGAPSGWMARVKANWPALIYELMELAYVLVDFTALTRAIRRIRPDFIYERYSLFLPSGVWASKLFSIPLFLEVNAPLADERSRHGRLALRSVARRIETYTWSGADAVLAVTAVLAELIGERGIPRTRVHVVPNGIDTEAVVRANGAEIKKRYGPRDGDLILGFVGFLRHWHRLDRVVRLMANTGNQSLRFLVVGDGPARHSLVELAQKLGVVERLTFIGLVPRDEILDYVDAFDVALQPDVVDYASPLKLIEYIALGKAVVAPDRANIREIVDHGENGYLFSAQDDNAFEAAVLRLCEDRDLREHLSRGASRTIAARHLTWVANAKRIVAMFENRHIGQPPPRQRGYVG